MEQNSPQTGPHLEDQFIFDKSIKEMQWGKEILSTNSVEITSYLKLFLLFWFLTFPNKFKNRLVCFFRDFD